MATRANSTRAVGRLTRAKTIPVATATMTMPTTVSISIRTLA